jgi:hypothetical protein
VTTQGNEDHSAAEPQPSIKSQKTSSKQRSTLKSQTVWTLGFGSLGFEICLGFVVWDFQNARTVPKSRTFSVQVLV